MHIFDIAQKDILQIIRDWKTALFLLVMPILFTVFFGLVFAPAPSAAQSKDERLPVGLVNHDSDGVISASLETLLGASEAIRPVLLEESQAAQGGEMVRQGELAAVLSLPAGYSQALAAGQPASLEIVVDQGTSAGRAVIAALDTITGRLLGAVEGAHIGTETYQAQVGFTDDQEQSQAFEKAFLLAIDAWLNPPLSVKMQPAAGATAAAALQPGGFNQSSAGMIVQFSVFGLINSAMILVLERKTRCLQRLLTTPIRRAEIIAGHVLAMFLVVFIQEIILIILGQFVFGVDYMRQPLAILLMAVAVALWAASLGLLIGALAKEEDQVVVLSLIAMFLLSAMGGAWFPLEVAGKAFSTIGHLLPSAWAMDGFQNIIVRGLNFNSVLAPVGILLAYTTAFFGLALWRFKFE